jgi:hypothetical protein
MAKRKAWTAGELQGRVACLERAIERFGRQHPAYPAMRTLLTRRRRQLEKARKK